MTLKTVDELRQEYLRTKEIRAEQERQRVEARQRAEEAARVQKEKAKWEVEIPQAIKWANEILWANTEYLFDPEFNSAPAFDPNPRVNLNVGADRILRLRPAQAASVWEQQTQDALRAFQEHKDDLTKLFANAGFELLVLGDRFSQEPTVLVVLPPSEQLMDITMFILGFFLGIGSFYALYRQKIKTFQIAIDRLDQQLTALRHLNHATWNIDNEDTLR